MESVDRDSINRELTGAEPDDRDSSRVEAAPGWRNPLRPVKAPGERYTFDDLRKIMQVLRSEEGCPWDRRQTHESLIPCLEEESGEVIDAIRNNDMENLCEELGDLLFQVMSHSQIAEEKGCFTADDVIDGISAKMIRRHPNVFGDAKVESMEEGMELWKKIKSEEKHKKAQKTLTKQG